MSDGPEISVRHATELDIPTVAALYRLLEAEMIPLEEMWPLADGLPEPITDSLMYELERQDSTFVVGLVEGVVFGFLIARVEPLLPQADGERVGSIRFVFVDPLVREISLGEQMRDVVMTELRTEGIARFDAHVVPGHRLVKNFFEAGGFSARSIIMHHDD